MKLCRTTLVAIVLIGLISAGPVWAAKKVKPPKVQVELLAGSTAVVPGQVIDLAVVFDIEQDWHIYWENPGEGGLATKFKWRLPEGFAVGPVSFPVPRRYIDATGTPTFILAGQPIMLAELMVPPEAEPTVPVTIGLELSWLVCKKLCYQGSKTLSLKLPVIADESKSEPANELTFRMAHSDLPAPVGKAKYLKSLSAVAGVDKVQPGSKFEVAVVFEVAPSHHVNAHKPLIDLLIPTDLFHYRTDGLLIGRPRFPRGELEAGLMPGKQQAVYRGKQVVVLPVEADLSLSGQTLSITGVLTYQACSDRTKQCFQPMAGDWSLTLPIAGADEKVTPINSELFKSAPQAAEEQAGVERVSEQRVYVSWLSRVQARLAELGIFGYLVMALVGGFILNLMPCVLPVISIKILSFVQQAKESRLRIFTLGLAFALGIEVSFVVLGALIVVMGQQWGGLFQYPQVVIGLAAVVTALALSLFGVFAIFPPKVVGELGEKVQTEGHLGAFGMGLLATLLGTACTAPFLSVVIAIATQQPPILGMLIFVVAGLGMAFPYVLLAAKPGWVKIIPRPGPWMKTFEQVVGFCLLATVIWLLGTVAAQLGGEGLLWTLLFLLFVSMGAWFYGKVEFGAPFRRKLSCYTAAGALVVGGWWLCFMVERQAEGIAWIPYSRERALEVVNEGRTVFIDYTADWCVNCKVNEKLVIDTPEVREVLKRLGVLAFKADYTLPDSEIKADLDKYGRAGVPMYVIIPGNRPDDAIVLDEILTKRVVIENLEQAVKDSRRAAVIGNSQSSQ